MAPLSRYVSDRQEWTQYLSGRRGDCAVYSVGGQVTSVHVKATGEMVKSPFNFDSLAQAHEVAAWCAEHGHNLPTSWSTVARILRPRAYCRPALAERLSTYCSVGGWQWQTHRKSNAPEHYDMVQAYRWASRFPLPRNVVGIVENPPVTQAFAYRVCEMWATEDWPAWPICPPFAMRRPFVRAIVTNRDEALPIKIRRVLFGVRVRTDTAMADAIESADVAEHFKANAMRQLWASWCNPQTHAMHTMRDGRMVKRTVFKNNEWTPLMSHAVTHRVRRSAYWASRAVVEPRRIHTDGICCFGVGKLETGQDLGQWRSKPRTG